MMEDRWTVGKLLKTSGSFWEACTLHAGVRLDVFTVLGDDALSGEEVADKVGGDVRGTKTLLNALKAMGLLVREENKYANTPESKTFLVKGAPGYIGYMIRHHHHLVPAWSRLSDAVRSGKPVRKRAGDEDEIETFLMGMFNQAMAIAPDLARQIDLSDRTRLLDLGGGPGTYAIHFCLSNPSLKAAVFDLPTTRPFALKTIERFGLRKRIDFMAGDYLENELKGSYDVAWLSHILHSLGPEKCRIVIEKAVSVIEPGGLILVHDFILNDTMDFPLFPAIFSLNMLVNTKEGRSYSEGEIRGMLSEVGVQKIERLPFKRPTDSGIISGVV